MAGAAAATAKSIGGRKVGDLAAVNAQENRKKDVVSISLHGWLCHDFFAPPPTTLLSSHASLSPASPSQEKQKAQGPLPGPQSWVHL